MRKRLKTLLVVLTGTIGSLIARENIGNNGQFGHKIAEQQSIMAGCVPATAQIELNVNNVRTRILAGGDMWWDLIGAKYEVPKGGGAHSLFAGSLWIGGVDAGNQLKVAAQTYRQNGNDFWPGPLDTTLVSVDVNTCSSYDKHFLITRQEVEDFIAYQSGTGPAGYTIPKSITDWPGNGDISKGQSHYLAPFFDHNGDGVYDPDLGDCPDYDVSNYVGSHRRKSVGQGCGAGLYGDQTIWWVFNDKGNIHTETNGQPIGLEIRAQAFAYKTNDELNDMTFYNYEVINWSQFPLNKTYFGVWVDADLGFFNDDYVGCDVGRGLGFCYNGYAADGSGATGTYGANPPAVGVDFFQGPKVSDPLNDGKDSYGTSFVDVNGRIGMAKFIYYNNDFTVRGNPTLAVHYYNYLSGFWQDGLPFTYGGDAYQEPGPVCDFMFPGQSDPTGLGTGGAVQSNWDEASVGNLPADRRFLQSAGPFTLAAGAVNTVTFGVVWARATQGGPSASVQVMKVADAKAQALFDNCFKITNGPDAPDITLQELKNKLVLYITNKPTSNNYKEQYHEKDPYISTGADTAYEFEGYKIYQLTDSSVSVSDLSNPDKARIVFQCDIKNNVKQIVNYYFDNSLSAWIPKEEVYGEDIGVVHSFLVTKDQFATGDNQLVNHKSYYFMAVTYAYNKGEIAANPYNSSQGLNVPYLQGRRNVKVKTGIPHDPAPEAHGTEQHADYGDGVKLTRVEGWGNGGNVLDITDASTIGILSSNRLIPVEYERGRGPVSIKVIDPLNVVKGDFVFKLTDTTRATGKWSLTNLTTGQVVNSDNTIKIEQEQIIPEWGLSVMVKSVVDPGDATGINNGFLEATMTFADETKLWLSGLADEEITDAPYSARNWIRSGKISMGTATDYVGIDDDQIYEKVLGGTVAPYRLCSYSDVTNNILGGPGWNNFTTQNKMKEVLNSVDIVITSDKSKWTRCPVLEMSDDFNMAQGGAAKHDLRRVPSVDKNGFTGDGIVSTTDENDPDYMAPYGMSWFPGYVINVETGERLNMAFGENSFLTSENGSDMKWNPTGSTFDALTGTPVFGGMHYVYVFAHTRDSVWTAGDAFLPSGPASVPRYDNGSALWQMLDAKFRQNSATSKYKKQVYTDAMWVSIPLLAQGHQLLETDVKIRLRVGRHYRKFYSQVKSKKDTAQVKQNNNFPMYTFNTNDLETHKADEVTAKNALDIINIVPNPYYAYSGYEQNQLDTRVKVTNLPEKCTVKIYTLNGTLIRTFKKDSPKTSLDWDLKNQANIPIASGMYIIHVDAPGIGEKILKWFGAIRPIDLDSY